MELLLERIDARLEALQLTDNDASDRAGMYRTLIRDLRRRQAENKPLRVRMETLNKLADALQTSVDYLLGRVVDPSSGSEQIRQIPVLNASALLADPNKRPDSYCIYPTIPVGPDAFAFIVHTDDMNYNPGPSLRPGDMIIVDPAIKPLPGDAVLAVVEFSDTKHENAEKHVVARQYRQRTTAGGAIFVLLAPLNPAFPTFEVIEPDKNGHILGVVVEHRRSFTTQRRIVMP